MVSTSGLPVISLSFSGCGFLGMYHVGSLACWQEHLDRSAAAAAAPRSDTVSAENGVAEKESAGVVPEENPPRFALKNALGASAGALVAAALVLDYPAEALKAKLLRVAAEVRSLTFGPFNPRFNANEFFREELQLVLPENAFRSASGRLYISLTDTSLRNVLQSEFGSNEELTQALVCSCYLPAFSAYQIPTFAGKPFLDGGFSNNQPVIDEATTVRISPFAGDSQICPQDGGGNGAKRRLLFQKFSTGERMELSLANAKRLAEAMIPPNNLETLYDLGYQQTDEFIRSGRVRDFFHPK